MLSTEQIPEGNHGDSARIRQIINEYASDLEQLPLLNPVLSQALFGMRYRQYMNELALAMLLTQSERSSDHFNKEVFIFVLGTSVFNLILTGVVWFIVRRILNVESQFKTMALLSAASPNENLIYAKMCTVLGLITSLLIFLLSALIIRNSSDLKNSFNNMLFAGLFGIVVALTRIASSMHAENQQNKSIILAKIRYELIQEPKLEEIKQYYLDQPWWELKLAYLSTTLIYLTILLATTRSPLALGISIILTGLVLAAKDIFSVLYPTKELGTNRFYHSPGSLLANQNMPILKWGYPLVCLLTVLVLGTMISATDPNGKSLGRLLFFSMLLLTNMKAKTEDFLDYLAVINKIYRYTRAESDGYSQFVCNFFNENKADIKSSSSSPLLESGNVSNRESILELG